MFGKNRIKGGSATSKDEWLDGVKQLKMETNWHCTLRMFKQHTCRSNQGQVHSSGDCSNGGSRFFLSKNGDFPLPLCHDGSTDVYFGWVQTVLKKCAGVWWPLGPIFFLQSWRSQGAGNQEMFRVRPKNDHWIIFMVYHPASAVSEWLSSTAFCGWWMEFQMFQIQFPDFPISYLNGAVCTTGIHFFNTGALCSPMPLRKARGA